MRLKFVSMLLSFGAACWMLATCPLSAHAAPAPDQKPAASSAARDAAPQCPWVRSKAPIAQRVDQLLGAMTLGEKIQELHGMDNTAYAGELPAIPRLCIPSLTLLDGPAGVGDGLMGVTQLPAPVALAASWDRNLARQYGAVVGEEQWGKGVEIDLGPTVNIVRDPRWGRAFETYSEDPYLSAQVGAGYIEGLQKTGVMAEVKHWALYNNETNRNTPLDDVIVNERTMQEIYLPQFGSIIHQADPASIMCSYASVNGVTACQDPFLLNRVLRDQFHFDGFVVSDWGATHSTVASARAGLNMEMPGGAYYGDALKQAVASGVVPASTINQLVRPILAKMFEFDLFTRRPTGTPYSMVTTSAHAETGEKIAEAGAVLLKNEDQVLPLSTAKIHSIAVIGADAGADAMTAGGGSAQVTADSIVTPFEGIRERAGQPIEVKYAQGNKPFDGPPLIPARYLTPASGEGHGLTEKIYSNRSIAGAPVLSRTASRLIFQFQSWGRPPAAGLKPGNWSAKFTGTLRPPVSGEYTFSLTGSGTAQLTIAGEKLVPLQPLSDYAETGSIRLTAGQAVPIELDYQATAQGSPLRLGWQTPLPGFTGPREQALVAQAVALAKSSDVAIVFASKFESEGSDLDNIDLPGDQNRLIAEVAQANPNTIVVLNTGSAVTMPWFSKVKGVIEAWYPGQDDGKAIAALVFGDVNPSGKLPVTFPKELADVPASTPGRWPGVDGRVHYSEGLNVGYRWYESRHIAPMFAFGSGLSYTTFAFSHLKVAPERISSSGTVTVTTDIANTGQRSGADVVELYVGDPASTGEPPQQLKGFKKVFLKPGQTRQVTFSLPAHAFATWSKSRPGWTVAGGDYQILVGDSSVNLPEHASVHVSGRQE